VDGEKWTRLIEDAVPEGRRESSPGRKSLRENHWMNPFSKLSPVGTPESSPGRQSWVSSHSHEQSRKGRLKVAQDGVPSYFQPSLRD
jgi:hypothetical protein